MADENEDQDVQEGEEVQKDQKKTKEPGGSKLVMVVVVVVGFVIMIFTPVITVFVVKSILPETVKTENPETNAQPVMLNLDAITVNIAETKGTRHLRLKPTLVLSEARLLTELSATTEMLNDRIMLAASRKTVDELDGAAGRQSLKRDIISEINAVIKDKIAGSVIDVYFSEFLIQ